MVYFIQSAGPRGPIKIGSSHPPWARLRKLATGNPDRLALLVTIPGGLEEEAQLHERFIGIRRRGEWFEPDPRLLGFIEGLICLRAALAPLDDEEDTPAFTGDRAMISAEPTALELPEQGTSPT